MISFSCLHCDLKLQVKPEFAGRSSWCPTCKQPLVVPVPSPTQADVAPGPIDGTDSSLAQAGVDGGVSLVPATSDARAGQRSVAEILARQTNRGERYLIEAEIARGGMGAVLRAVDCDIRREVAVKYLLDQADPDNKLRFIEEAQITGQLEHPNIVPVHELGVDKEKRLFFAMKMVKGKSLAQVLDELRQNPKTAEKEYSLTRLLNVFVNVCNALAYAHSRGVIHRDLKPANIMLGDFGEVYLMDWGLAKVLRGGPTMEVDSATAAVSQSANHHRSLAGSSTIETSRQVQPDLTQEGAIVGTPVYMPPEQANGQVQAIDQRSDIYSLGAILYEILCWQPPVEKSGGYLDILIRVTQGEIVPPEQRHPARASKTPKELSAVAMKALAMQPAHRYPSVEALRRDIERFLEGRSVSAKEDTKREMLWKFVKRNQAVSATAFVALGVLGVVLLFTFQNYLALMSQQRRTREAVPAFLSAGRLAVNNGDFNDALAQATVAVDYDPDNAPAHLFKGQLLIVQKRFPEARLELEQYLKVRSDDAAAEGLLKLCQPTTVGDAATSLAFAELFTEQNEHGLADGVTRDWGGNQGEARKRLLEMHRQRIEAAWPGLGSRLQLIEGEYHLSLAQSKQVGDLTPLRGMPLVSLELIGCSGVRDLTPLKGMPLTKLNLDGCEEVRDLTPLRELPLRSLNLANCRQLRDLTPLRKLPLTVLDLHGCGQVSDLTPLKSVPLTMLDLSGCDQVRDVTPLKDVMLSELLFMPKSVTKGIWVLRQMQSLNALGVNGANKWRPPEFWEKYDAGEFK
jgi:serine/threonine protein kinase